MNKNYFVFHENPLCFVIEGYERKFIDTGDWFMVHGCLVSSS